MSAKIRVVAQPLGFPGAASQCLQALRVEPLQVLKAQPGQEVGWVIPIWGQVDQVQECLFREGNECLLTGCEG